MFKSLTLVLVLAFLLTFINPSFGTEFKSGQNIFISQSERINDDLIMAANNIKVQGTVTGDLICASQFLIQNGTVEGNVNAACKNLDVLGGVGGSVRAFCQNNTVSGEIKRNLINFSSSLNIRSGAKIGGDVTAFCGDLTMDGEIGKGLRCGAGIVVISGTINGNVNLDADEITLMPTAKILGDFHYKSKKEAKIESGAQISGESKWTKVLAKGKKKKGFFTTKNLVVKTVFLLAAILCGLFLILITKKFVKGAKEAVIQSSLKSLGLGFICLICIPIAIIILLITVIGIPIAVISLFAYLILFYIAKIFVGIALGEKILTGFKKNKDAPMGWSLITGLIVIYILTSLPYIGWIVYLAVLFIGFGAALQARKLLLA
jgi:cytoskeletal protein CcmA (bactofilin family)